MNNTRQTATQSDFKQNENDIRAFFARYRWMSNVNFCNDINVPYQVVKKWVNGTRRMPVKYQAIIIATYIRMVEFVTIIELMHNTQQLENENK